MAAEAGQAGMAEDEEFGPAFSVDEALKLLSDGNWRFRSGMPMGLNRTAMRRQEVAAGQKPFAAVVGCSDSRVPPELIFDVGLGDLFVVRAAGNVLDEAGLGSLEYAAEHLGVGLILVLGHSDCGAVKAAMARTPSDGHLAGLLRSIETFVPGWSTGMDDPVGLITKAHVGQMVLKVRQCEPVLSRLCGEGLLAVRGAFYDLQTGEVRFLPEEAMETF